MLILGMDTSGRQSTLALLRAEAAAAPGEWQTLESVALGDTRASEVLVPGIASLLQRQDIAKSALSLIAVASGPGSFTGLRVALATAKGLAEALAIPVIAVSVLESLAVASGMGGRVVAALDAQRGEIFFGEYTIESVNARHAARQVREEIVPGDVFVAKFGSVQAVPVITADAFLSERLRSAGVEASLVARPGAVEIAQIGFRKFLAGERADIAALDANYLRRSDAEIVFSRKSGSGNVQP